MPMTKLYKHKTRVGTFYIAEHAGKFHPLFEDESLGGYTTAQQAVDNLAGGHTFTAGDGSFETDELGIPDDLSEWNPI